MSNVGLSVCRGTIETEGQLDETKPVRPGVVSYLNKTRAPNARAAIQAAPSRTVI